MVKSTTLKHAEEPVLTDHFGSGRTPHLLSLPAETSRKSSHTAAHHDGHPSTACHGFVGELDLCKLLPWRAATRNAVSVDHLPPTSQARTTCFAQPNRPINLDGFSLLLAMVRAASSSLTQWDVAKQSRPTWDTNVVSRPSNSHVCAYWASLVNALPMIGQRS